jgi:hypothetical protein
LLAPDIVFRNDEDFDDPLVLTCSDNSDVGPDSPWPLLWKALLAAGVAAHNSNVLEVLVLFTGSRDSLPCINLYKYLTCSLISKTFFTVSNKDSLMEHLLTSLDLHSSLEISNIMYEILSSLMDLFYRLYTPDIPCIDRIVSILKVLFEKICLDKQTSNEHHSKMQLLRATMLRVTLKIQDAEVFGYYAFENVLKDLPLAVSLGITVSDVYALLGIISDRADVETLIKHEAGMEEVS